MPNDPSDEAPELPVEAQAAPQPVPEPRAAAPQPKRIALALQRAVKGAGESWALACANALRVEGRPVAGGWPGTITEARQRVRVCAASELGSRFTITNEELETLTRMAYETAKKVWLARTERISGE